jgi:hypothetical protein
VIFLVYSCSKEEIEPIQLKSEQQDLIISANEVAGLKEALHASLRIDQHGGFSVYQASEHTASEFTIDYEHVRQKIDSSGNILFTFGLFDKDNDPKTFMNMILKKDIDHGYQTPYILKFEMTEEFFNEFQFSHSLLNFEGTIKKLAFAQNSQPATYQANIENTRSSTSTVSCPDGNTIEMSNQQRKHDQTTTNELGDNPGSSGTIITTYEICEYFLVTTTWLVNGGTEFAYTYEDTTIEVECTTETISEDFNQLSANTGSDPCDALNDDVGVFYPNSIIDVEELIDDLLLRPCMQQLMPEIKGLSKGMGYMINKFKLTSTPNNPITVQNWKLQDGNLGGQSTGQTSSVYNKTTFTVTSTFDSQAFKKASDLSWARTILHEGVHAYMVAFYSQNRSSFMGTYPQMVKDWGIYQNWNDTHHEEFARSLVQDIAKALEEFGKGRGYNHNYQFYEDMAWAGLQTTSTFQSLPASDQNRILNTIAIELTGKDSNGNTKTQKGQNAGC